MRILLQTAIKSGWALNLTSGYRNGLATQEEVMAATHNHRLKAALLQSISVRLESKKLEAEALEQELSYLR